MHDGISGPIRNFHVRSLTFACPEEGSVVGMLRRWRRKKLTADILSKTFVSSLHGFAHLSISCTIEGGWKFGAHAHAQLIHLVDEHVVIKWRHYMMTSVFASHRCTRWATCMEGVIA